MKSIPENAPVLWRENFPVPAADGHKYQRGHALLLGGAIDRAGAIKLAARSALRGGAGVVSVACNREALPVYAQAFQSIMTKRAENAEEFAHLMEDRHISAVLIGPNAQQTLHTKNCVLAALAAGKPCVLDADALNVFAGSPEPLFQAIHSPCILTPHGGEFTRLFGEAGSGNEYQAATAAAMRAQAVVILKGAHSVIAAPDGALRLQKQSSRYLATAGSGDVLAGLCTGLLAQGMPAFDAASAAVWLHAQAGLRFGPGLIAEDIPDLLPPLLRELLS